MNRDKLLLEISKNQKNVNFDTFCKLIEAFDFTYRGGKGSHRIYKHENIIELVNIQNVNGQAKPYQIKQFLNIIDKYKLSEKENG